MRKKIQLLVLVGALISPTLAAVCQWECPYMAGMSDDESASHELLVSSGMNMECCAAQVAQVRNPLAELTVKFAPTVPDQPPQVLAQAPAQRELIHESPPGSLNLPAFTDSPTILRI